MAAPNYYQILGIVPTATISEIEAAWEALYNKWRQLVTHREYGLQAEEALRNLEQVRKVLTNPDRRAAYDAGIGLGGGTGGLVDPSAILAGLPPTFGAAQRPGHNQCDPAQRVDAWLCPECGAASAIATMFCQQCGTRLGRDCPFCHQPVYVRAVYCPKCGVNIADCEHRVADQCAICGTRVRGSAEACENCGVDLREGPLIVKWLESVKVTGLYEGEKTYMAKSVVEGPFSGVFEACRTALSSVTIKPDEFSSHLVKSVCAEVDRGTITAEIDRGWLHEKPHVAVMVQNSVGRHRGLAVAATCRCGEEYGRAAVTQIMCALTAGLRSTPIASLGPAPRKRVSDSQDRVR